MTLSERSERKGGGMEFEPKVRVVALDMEVLAVARTFISMHFGNAEKWEKINQAIWEVIESDHDSAFNLSAVDLVVESISCDGDDILAVLSLLSSSSARILTMKFLSGSSSGREVMPSEFVRNLTDWWKNKSLSEEKWRTWASETKVRWVPSGGRQES